MKFLFDDDDDEWAEEEEEEHEPEAADDGENVAEISLEALLDQLTYEGGSAGVGSDLASICRRIASPFPAEEGVDCAVANIVHLRRTNVLVSNHTGTMAQCRGPAGERLREAGAVDALLLALFRLLVGGPACSCHGVSLPDVVRGDDRPNRAAAYSSLQDTVAGVYRDRLGCELPSGDVLLRALQNSALDLATSALGGVRDLACGSAGNRAAILQWRPPDGPGGVRNGAELLGAYIRRYHGIDWRDIVLGLRFEDEDESVKGASYTKRGVKELRLLTNTLGCIRNSSHSTSDLCEAFYSFGLVDLLTWRLIGNVGKRAIGRLPRLPDASSPWREACFRCACALINISEKNECTAKKVGTNRELTLLLIESWGGVNVNDIRATKRGLPPLHLGLVAILNAARDEAPEGDVDDVVHYVLEREKMRKGVARANNLIQRRSR